MTPLHRTIFSRILNSLFARHETVVDQASNLKAGLGAVVGMMAVGQLAVLTGLPLMLAPLGATVVLLFGQPSSPLAQPINVMAGYLVGTVTCEVAFAAFPGTWVAAAVAVGFIVVVMRALRVTHPPAGAVPILGFGGAVHGGTLFATLLLGCITVICLAFVVHRIPPRRDYPIGMK
ncbi:MAG: HPP family protein [Rhizobiaceae bacterium]